MTNLTPAGWHADPTDPNLMRYWDGQQWTAQTQPKPPPGPSSAIAHVSHPVDSSIENYRMVNNVMAALAVVCLIAFVAFLWVESVLAWVALAACIAFLAVGFGAARTANKLIRQAYGDQA